MRYADGKEPMILIDIFGDTAAGSIGRIFELLEDRVLYDRWQEIMNHEECTEE